MKIGPGPSVELSRFNKPDDELEVMYGLPRYAHFCKKCNMSNQQPMSSNEYAHSKNSKKQRCPSMKTVFAMPVTLMN